MADQPHYRTQRRIEWHDTDAAGIAHFTCFLRYMEEAEHEYLRTLGIGVLMQDDEGRLSWPRVAVGCDFSGAVRYDDMLDIDVRVARLGDKSVTYEFNFTHQGRAVAQGRTTAVCCRLQADGPPRSIRIPTWIASRFPRDGQSGSPLEPTE